MLRAIWWLMFATLAAGQTPGEVQTVEIGGRTIRYTVQAGYAVSQGDIIVGRADDPQSFRSTRRRSLQYRGSDSALWPDATMYYTMDSDIPVEANVRAAIDYWNAVGPFKILPRTDQTNYVRFQKIEIDAACNSWVGMIGGAQTIGVTPSCSVGSAIHELGHAWGLMHEQSRWDRNSYITVLYENADKRFWYAFDQDLDSYDKGYYDYDSIMHYSAAGFGRIFLDTIATVPPGIPIGQRAGLSAGDIDAISRMYGFVPTTTTITSAPAGLQITVDGTVVTTPWKVGWTPGSQHTVSVATQGINPRYVFARWSDGGAAAHAITASADTTVFCAAFQRQFPVTYGVASGQGSVSVTPPPQDGYMTDRMPFVVTATPANGYQFERWTGFTYLGSSGVSVSASSARVQNYGGLSDYRARFTQAPLHLVDSIPQGAAVTVDGVAYLTPVKFDWAPGSSHVIAAATNSQGNNTRRFTFSEWDDGSPLSRTVIAQAEGAVYKVKFKEEFLLDIGLIGSGTVRVSPGSADGFYAAGSQVTLTAVPSSGRTFRYWVGELAGNTATKTLVMDQERSATAYFGNALPFLIYHGASFGVNRIPGMAGAEVAPGEMVSIFGAGIGPASSGRTQSGADGKMPTSVDGVSVTFNGTPAPITFAGPDQINVIVPYSVAGQAQTQIVVRRPSGNLSDVAAVTETIPGLFTYDGSGTGPVAALNEDGSINSAANPAAPGSVVVLYATGAGEFAKSFADGAILGAELVSPKAPVYVRFDRLPAVVTYAGVAPYLVNGALQVNAVIPKELIGGGAIAVRIVAGTSASPPGTTIWVK